MKKIYLKHYEAPATEVLEIEVEKGFAVSAGGEGGNWKTPGFGNNEDY